MDVAACHAQIGGVHTMHRALPLTSGDVEGALSTSLAALWPLLSEILQASQDGNDVEAARDTALPKPPTAVDEAAAIVSDLVLRGTGGAARSLHGSCRQ